jgi:hypothetical protein
MTDYIAIKLPVLHGTSALDDDGEDIERVCPLCGNGISYPQPFSFGEPDTKPVDRVVLSSRFGTVHADCYPARLQRMEVREAWVTVAEDIARRPTKFTAAEVRAALTALARIAREAGIA